MSWSDIRCKLDELFENAFEAEKISEAKNTENYAKIKEFLTKLFEIDGDAVVHDGGWYPPLTKEGWNNPNSSNWFEQIPTSRPFRRISEDFNGSLAKKIFLNLNRQLKAFNNYHDD